MTIGEKIRALRKALDLTQEQVAAGAENPQFLREDVTKVEKGQNKLTTHKMRVGMAAGLGLSVPDLDDYLNGAMTLDEAVAVAKRSGGRSARKPKATLSAPVSDTEIPPPLGGREQMELAITRALDVRRGHLLSDANAVQTALRNAPVDVDPDALADAAGRWLDAAMALRKRNLVVTAEALLIWLTVGPVKVAVPPKTEPLFEDSESGFRPRATG